MSDTGTQLGTTAAPAPAAAPPPNDTGGAGSQENVLADLAGERKARQAAESRNKEYETKLAKIEEANKSEQEKALDKARQEGRDEASKSVLSTANARILKTEVKRLAADKFADPADPVGALDLSAFTVDEEGNVDEKAIGKALDDLLKHKPHWAKSTQRTTGSADQGVTGTAGNTGGDMNAFIRRSAGRS